MGGRVGWEFTLVSLGGYCSNCLISPWFVGGKIRKNNEYMSYTMGYVWLIGRGNLMVTKQ
jgi:hypothetical protein